jgi:integrase
MVRRMWQAAGPHRLTSTPAWGSRYRACVIDRKRVRPGDVKPSAALVPPARARRDASVAEFAREWLRERSERTRAADTQRLRDHVFPLLGNRKVRELKTEDVVQVVRVTLAKKGMKPKSARNAYDVFAELLGAALEQRLLSDDPRALPEDIWPAEAAAPRPRFSRDEVRALTLDERLDADQRLFDLLLFESGLASPEVCELRFGDWTTHVPAPVSAQLVAAVERWRESGFEGVYGRPPNDDDFLVPRRSDVSQPHTEGSAFKAFRRACVALGIKTRSPQAVRNTFEDEHATPAPSGVPGADDAG